MKKHVHIFWLLVSWLAFQSFFLFVDGWFTHDSKPGNFRVGFPAQPSEIKKDFFYGNSVFKSTITFCQKGTSAFGILWFDHPFHTSAALSFEKLNMVLDSAQSYLFHSEHLHLKEIKELKLGGSDFLGREYQYTTEDSSALIRNRVFLVNYRFYVLSTSVPVTNSDDPTDAKFLNSFTFLDLNQLKK